ncbi:hypothetical protein [Roseibium sp.]|uniref:hypothetical protein n=1 Tax=Roseibium sp. TaxID=1936156 RepID=UPI003267335F
MNAGGSFCNWMRSRPMSSQADTVPGSRLSVLLGVDERGTALLRALFVQSTGTLGIDGATLFDRLEVTGSFKEALGVSDNALEVLYARAFQLIQTGHSSRAEDIFRALCALDGEQVDFWLGYGICLRAREDNGQAMLAFDVAVKLAPDAPAPHLHRLELFIRTGRWEEAAEALALFDERADNAKDASFPEAAAPFRKALEMRET